MITEHIALPEQTIGSLHSAADIAARTEAVPTDDSLIQALKTCESRQIALDSWGMAVGILLFDALFLAVWFLSLAPRGPAAIYTELVISVGFGSIWLAIRKPWRDKRPRQAECRRLLEQLAERGAPDAGDDPVFRDTLRVLSLPISGETRETRALARRLYLRHGETAGHDLPIAAIDRANPSDQLPLPAVETGVASGEA